MNAKYILLALTLVSVFMGITSCGSKSDKKSVEVAITSDIVTSTLLKLQFENCISVSLLNDDEQQTRLEDEDGKLVLSYLSSGVYDKERNESGIKYKMRTADYSFIVEFKNGEKETVQYWTDSLLILSDGEWYLPLSAMNISSSLEKYTSE